MTALVAFVPATGAAAEGEMAVYSCTAGRDGTATELGAYYVREYKLGADRVVELWQESNGLDGLQTSSSMACGEPADRLVAKLCTIRCAI